jgi:hypothetical protein
MVIRAGVIDAQTNGDGCGRITGGKAKGWQEYQHAGGRQQANHW